MLPGANASPFPQEIHLVTAADVRAALSSARVKGPNGESPLLDQFAAPAMVDWEEIAKDHVQN